MEKITAKNKKNQTLINRALRYLEQYYEYNEIRDKAEDLGDKKLYNQMDKKCEFIFNRYLETLEQLPKYERKTFDNL